MTAGTTGNGSATSSRMMVTWRSPEMLFDMDGTLIDSIPAVEDAWRRWALEEEIEVPAAAQFHGRTAVDLVASMVSPERFGRAFERLEALEQNPSVPIRILPGALELINTLPRDRWSIVTSAAASVASARLHHSGLPLPSVLITADSVSRGKPDPEPYRSGSRWHHAKYPAIGVEDTVAGLKSAAAAGCQTIGVVGTHTFSELLPHADLVVDSLRDVSVSSASDGLLIVKIFASMQSLK